MMLKRRLHEATILRFLVPLGGSDKMEVKDQNVQTNTLEMKDQNTQTEIVQINDQPVQAESTTQQQGSKTASLDVFVMHNTFMQSRKV